MRKAESMFLSISILMILVALVFLVLTISAIKAALPVETPAEVPPVEVPDYSQSLEALEGQVDYLKKKMEELQGRIQDIRDRLDSLLETFDMAETYTITGYAPLDPQAVYGLDYIGNPAVTASGDRPIPGQTVAADKSIPFGTRVWIEGVGARTVNDRGRAIKRGRLDLCMETRDEALQFGRQRRKVIILKEG
jgi:3D (Asp-Asp-Asp) domain-containing protein